MYKIRTYAIVTVLLYSTIKLTHLYVFNKYYLYLLIIILAIYLATLIIIREHYVLSASFNK